MGTGDFKPRLYHLPLVVSILAPLPPAQATPGYQDGLSAFQAGNFQRAVTIMERHAALGNAKAQYFLSTLYRTGQGVERNPARAFHWCLQAAEEGLPEAQFQLGVMYLRGEGISADDDRAFEWLWRAADRGYPQAKEVLEYVLYEEDFTFGC